MKCKHFLSLVSDYIDGTLAPRQCADLEEHLSDCQRCRTFVNTLRATISLCQSRLYRDVPPPIHQTLHRMIREEWEICKVEVSVGVPKFPFGEIVEFKDKINVSITLPGINKEDITLIVRQDYIEISGFRKKYEGIYYLNEIKYGPFSRKFKLPYSVNLSKVQAYLKNGILKVILPKV